MKDALSAGDLDTNLHPRCDITENERSGRVSDLRIVQLPWISYLRLCGQLFATYHAMPAVPQPALPLHGPSGRDRCSMIIPHRSAPCLPAAVDLAGLTSTAPDSRAPRQLGQARLTWPTSGLFGRGMSSPVFATAATQLLFCGLGDLATLPL